MSGAMFLLPQYLHGMHRDNFNLLTGGGGGGDLWDHGGVTIHLLHLVILQVLRYCTWQSQNKHSLLDFYLVCENNINML